MEDFQEPVAFDSENYILGAMILDNKAVPIVRGILKEEDFYREHLIYLLYTD